ncbi:MAG: thioesterase [Candidatus Omnitrophica bacterium CG11_big_fil_rev_8_21_14_0_20_45_26]|uniref:Thioesterase n=1 Tax=Candidatus Abzuiibacterium crystallinum TaxID=1974748 RepID=A0A2H0LRK4_9BACT|nr:MAG: thioesterase [Candidatus Omnitrophica bacterium CG11_big_fil_rev_8_21_14_0_20_45_26]PIW64571.1 MAG: thioesterase [Candidatus Omnitrophica bacterium CG12_big_fil_rev_8_21_14_0_65_45_16]
MNLYWRLFMIRLKAWLGKKLKPMDESRIRLRIYPNDLDTYFHVNNGRYLTLMDLGRMDLFMRAGILGKMKPKRWRFFLGSSTIRFRRSLKMFQSFELRTRIVCWTDKWLLVEQKFIRHESVVAAGYIKGVFYGAKGSISMEEALGVIQPGQISPPVPESIAWWLKSESFHRVTL